MEPTIQPASTVPDELVKEYLRSRGMSPEIIEWKYFDTTFNHDRERGYVWMHNNRVGGFLGFVPFTLGRGHRSWDAMWTCDWSRKPGDAARGIGRKLRVEAAKSFDYLIGFGGSKITRRLSSQIATDTIFDAGVVLHLPLRLGAVCHLLTRRMPFLSLSRWHTLGRIPLWRLPSRPLHCLARTETGVARAIGPLVQSDRGNGWYPRYDLDYLEWQLVRCPVVVCGTCYIPVDSGARAAALFWRPIASTDFWRMALWCQEGAQEELAAVLAEAIHHVYNKGGMVVSMIASRQDTDLIALLKSKRFIPSRRRMPLRIHMQRSTSQAIDEVSGLSYLDSDLAYRF